MCFMWADYKCVLCGHITLVFYVGILHLCFIWADYNHVLCGQISSES